jgi:hypothetical protein
VRKSLRLWGPDKDDAMYNRRNLAFYSAIFALVVWPHELIVLHIVFGVDIDLIKALLIYVGTVAGTSIGGYIWSAMKTPDNGKTDK